MDDSDTRSCRRKSYFGAPRRRSVCVGRCDWSYDATAHHHAFSLPLPGVPQTSRHVVRRVRREVRSRHVSLAERHGEDRHLAAPATGRTRSLLFGVRFKVPSVRSWVLQAGVFMPAGALDGELGIRPQMHIFVSSKPHRRMLRRRVAGHTMPIHRSGARHAVENPPRPSREGVASGSRACGTRALRARGPAARDGPLSLFAAAGARWRAHHACRSRVEAPGAQVHARRRNAHRVSDLPEARSSSSVPRSAATAADFCRAARSGPGAWCVVPVGAARFRSGDSPAGASVTSRPRANWFDITDGVPQFAKLRPPKFDGRAASAAFRQRGAAA